MTFKDSVVSGFRNAFVFKGRARRPEYWWFFLFVFGGAFLVGLLVMLVLGPGGGILVSLFQLSVLVPFLAVGWRRLQDTGRPGWWLLVPSTVVMVSALISGSLTRTMMEGGMGGLLMDGQSSQAGGMFEAGASATTVVALSVAQFLAGAVIVWWMSRPSQHGANAYGPEPRVR